jgi:hypothetical protein
MSLDGFSAGPEDAMDWVFEYVHPSADAVDVIGEIGAVLSGRRSYDVGERDAGKPSEATWPTTSPHRLGEPWWRWSA